MSDYEIGDVVVGYFSCFVANDRGRRQVERGRVRVTHRFIDRGYKAFGGDDLDADAKGRGSGGWGYDDEIEEVLPRIPHPMARAMGQA